MRSPPTLTGAQRRDLRGRGHSLDPVVRVGQKGLTPALEEEAERALADHELIKVRLAGDRAERAAAAEELAGRLGAARVGLVGAVLLLYRPHADPERRRIRLGQPAEDES